MPAHSLHRVQLGVGVTAKVCSTARDCTDEYMPGMSGMGSGRLDLQRKAWLITGPSPARGGIPATR